MPRSAPFLFRAADPIFRYDPRLCLAGGKKPRHNQQDLFRDEKNNAKFLACFFGSREAQKRIFIHSSFCSEISYGKN